MNLLTIFTPTYNRAYILPQLYASLTRQSSNNFEWVVVDDGSADETETLVQSWISENKIRIIYYKQPNQGKHIAINTGAKLAHGELFFIVDSDDYLTDDAVEKVNSFWNKEDPTEDISGIISYRKFHDGKLVGTSLPEGLKKCKLRETGSKYGSTGDKVVIYRTDVIKCYPYPKFEGERFLGESYVYNQIDDNYDMLILDDRLYYFAYQKDGLSQDFRKLYRNNPNGFLIDFEQSLKYCVGRKAKLKQYAHIVCLRIRLGTLHEYVVKGLALDKMLAIPLGIALYIKIFLLKASDVKPFEESED